nr:hypothetical protein CFP56_04176 [Quercus suber]
MARLHECTVRCRARCFAHRRVVLRADVTMSTASHRVLGAQPQPRWERSRGDRTGYIPAQPSARSDTTNDRDALVYSGSTRAALPGMVYQSRVQCSRELFARRPRMSRTTL